MIELVTTVGVYRWHCEPGAAAASHGADKLTCLRCINTSTCICSAVRRTTAVRQSYTAISRHLQTTGQLSVHST